MSGSSNTADPSGHERCLPRPSTKALQSVEERQEKEMSKRLAAERAELLKNKKAAVQQKAAQRKQAHLSNASRVVQDPNTLTGSDPAFTSTSTATPQLGTRKPTSNVPQPSTGVHAVPRPSTVAAGTGSHSSTVAAAPRLSTVAAASHLSTAAAGNQSSSPICDKVRSSTTNGNDSGDNDGDGLYDRDPRQDDPRSIYYVGHSVDVEYEELLQRERKEEAEREDEARHTAAKSPGCSYKRSLSFTSSSDSQVRPFKIHTSMKPKAGNYGPAVQRLISDAQ